MALSNDLNWEARADGNAANGGAFKRGATGVDRSQQAAPHATLTTAATVHTTTTQINVPGGEHTVHADDVGNVLFNTGGTSTAGRYEITSVDVPNNRWIVDRAVGTAGQTVAGRMGGAVADPATATATGAWNSSNTLWVRGDAGTFSRSTTWVPNPAGGQYTTAARGLRIIGYDTTRGDTPTGADRPTISQTATSTIAYQVTGEVFLENFRFLCNDHAGTKGIYIGTICRIFNCYVSGAGSTGIDGNGGGVGIFVDCEVDDCAAGAANGLLVGPGTAIGCWAHDNPCTGIYLGQTGALHRCLSTNNTGASSDGILAFYQSIIEQCTAHGNGRDGIRYDGGFDFQRIIRGNLLTDNAGYGINFPSGLMVKSPHCDYNGFWSNGSGETNGLSDTGGSHTSADYTTHNVTLGGDPYKDAASDDFRLNETDGSDLWGMSPFPFVDIGAFQHDPADEPAPGGGGGGPLVGGRLVA